MGAGYIKACALVALELSLNSLHLEGWWILTTANLSSHPTWYFYCAGGTAPGAELDLCTIACSLTSIWYWWLSWLMLCSRNALYTIDMSHLQ